MASQNNNNVHDKWIWLDLEMTGLDEQTCAILQAAMIITDSQLNELASTELVIWQPDAVLNSTAPFIREMHTKNGLLNRVRSSVTSVAEAEKQLMEILTKHVGYKRGVLAGNSIYLDRRFLKKYMPTFESYLHYRQLDVSSLKVLCQETFGARGKAPNKQSSHTAYEDVQASIGELKFYLANCFKQPNR